MSESPRPNVLLIVTDQHRLSALGAYGETPCHTPHLDALAADGMMFREAYCPTAICSPARASMLTGMLPHRHGMTGNIGDLGCNQQHIADHPDLLSRRMNAAGYQCGYTGKWHLCAEENKRTRFQSDYILSTPTSLGFVGQDCHGHGGGGFGYQAYKDYLTAHGYEYHIDHIDAAFGHEAGVWHGPNESTMPYYLTEHSLELMQQFAANDKPWFIWHNFWGPHEPYFVPQHYLDLYKNIDIPPWPDFGWDADSVLGPHRRWLVKPQPEWTYWERLIKFYYGFTTLIDEQIGRLIAHLKETGRYDNTYIVFTADHGESLGSHGGLANKGLQPFQETIQVPLIITGPGVSAGEDREHLVANTDIYATITAWGQAPTPEGDIQSQDLSPLLSQPSQSSSQTDADWRDCWVVESHGVSGFLTTQRVLRWQNYSYTWSAGFPELLFDLAADPHQLHNLAEIPGYAAAVTACRGRLLQWMTDERDMAKPAFVQDIALCESGKVT